MENDSKNNAGQRQERKKQILRGVMFLIGLFLSGLGVAVTKQGNLGVSPVSSVANIVSMHFTWLSMGNWLIIWNCVLILGQVILLGREFQWYQLLQIPLSFLFGYFTDFGLYISQFMVSEFYPIRLTCVVLGTVILGFGIALTVRANLIMNSGEAFVKALADRTGKEFGNIKLCFDISCVLLSLLLSLILFEGEIVGTREGTVIAALGTGLCVKAFQRLLSLKDRKEEA